MTACPADVLLVYTAQSTNIESSQAPTLTNITSLVPLQGEIHELLLQFAEAGATVVRLKGGDPYVFGRYV